MFESETEKMKVSPVEAKAFLYTRSRSNETNARPARKKSLPRAEV